MVEAAASAAGWGGERPSAGAAGGRGRGFAFARYKNASTYVAVVVDVELERATGAVRLVKVVAAIDCGRAVNPDGVRDQSEGGIVQGLSWSLKEEMRFDRRRILTRDWFSYSILSADEIPPIDVVLLDRPGQPSLGAGEGSCGPAAAALVNAVSQAAGRRIRMLPLNPARVLAAMQR